MLSFLGSNLQSIKALMHPRWEDYNYELADPINNRLHWLGDGQTYNEKTLSGDRTYFFFHTATCAFGKSNEQH